MKLRRAWAFLVAFYFTASPWASQHSDFQTLCDTERREVEIKWQGKRILLYVFGTNQFKPYVKELFTLDGRNVLRDAPADHLHHHGLMYAIRVNGINFWEEVGDPGRERSVRIAADRSDLNRGAFTQMVQWTANTSNIPLLYETRTISVAVDPNQNEVAVDWESKFQVGAAPVKLTGSAYNGLGLRLPESFDHVALHQNSENAPYTDEAKWDVTAADWSAVTGTLVGKQAMVALIAAPAIRGETHFFTMLNPFAYLSVTQNVEKQPLEYAPGEHFAVRYCVAVYNEPKSAAFLKARHREWIGDCK